jgi:3-methyladenine DNA glycosylase/8-oxoguanine DNA glycosylase
MSSGASAKPEYPADAHLEFVPHHPTDLHRTLAPLARGQFDPTIRIGSPAEGIWRATSTPDGPAVQHLVQRSGVIAASAWGPGARWATQRTPVLVGANDEDGEFSIDSSRHELLHRTWRLNRGVRVPATLRVWDALFRAVLEQKVTGKEAALSYRQLVGRLGTPAPPSPGPSLRLVPAPAVVAETPHHVFMAANVERKRADTIRQAAGYAHRLEEAVGVSIVEVNRRLKAIPGIGDWTINEVGLIALGDADAVSVGDFHLKNYVSWALAGRPRGTDDEMIELLEPYRPHRARMTRIIALSGLRPPRYGPRLTIQQRW